MKLTNQIEFSDKIDHDGEMEVEIEAGYNTTGNAWIDRDDARDIIHHLKIMFEIDLDKEI